MPRDLHKELKQRARKLGLTGDAYTKYVHGTLQKVENQRKRKRQATDNINKGR